MILRSIKLENWRCFTNPVEVGPFDGGLNVLYAPNGSGKSTLLEALIRALFDSHRLTGEGIAAICPWGRELTPRVEVCFAHDGDEYRVAKRFVREPSSLLERRENGRFVRFHDGEKADEQLRSILRGVAPGRGPARADNLGLAQILWVPQGELTLRQLSGDLANGIRTALDAQVAGPGSGPLEKRIEELYSRYFAPTGKERTGKQAPPVADLRTQIEKVEQQLHQAQAEYLAFEQASRDVEDLRLRRDQARVNATVLRDEVDKTRRTKEAWDRASGDLRTAEAKAEAARLAYEALDTRLKEIEAAAVGRRAAEEEISRLEAEEPDLKRAVEEGGLAVARARALVEDARRGLDALEAEQELLDEATRHRQLRTACESLGKRLAQIESARKVVDDASATRARLVAPDAGTMRKIRTEFKARDAAQTQLDGALITLELVPERAGGLTVVAGEPAGEQALKRGAVVRVKGSPEVAVDLAGFGRIRARGPSESAQELQARLVKSEARLKNLTEGFAASSLDDLESLAEKAEALDRAVEEAEVKLETLLDDDNEDDLRNEHARSEAALAEIVVAHPDWKTAPPDEESLRSALKAKQAASRVEAEKADSALGQATTEESAATIKRAKLGALLAEQRKALRHWNDRLEQLEPDAPLPAERARRLGVLARESQAADEAVEQAREKLASSEDDPREALEILQGQLAAADGDAEEAIVALAGREAELRKTGESGSYSVVARAEEEVRALRERWREEMLRMSAVRLLRETVERCRREAVAAVAAPVERSATRILRRIAGARLGGIAIGEGFTPTGLRPELLGHAVGVDQASGGEQEQIFLATRLALAEIVAKGERQLVVLDDVLVATDTGRLARILRVLEETAERLQVMVLTCHPERYRGLRQAHFIDLAEARVDEGRS